MAVPTFTGLDVGLSGGSLNPSSAQSIVSVEEGDISVAEVEYSFPGFAGFFAHNLGARGREVVWSLALRCNNATTLTTILAALWTLRKSGAVGALTTSLGRSYAQAKVKSVTLQGRTDTIMGGSLNGWVRQEVRVVFLVMSGE